MLCVGVKRMWKTVVGLMLILVAVLFLMSVLLPVVQAAENTKGEEPCCELFGVWIFAPQGLQGSFLPNHRFLWQSRIYVYDCSGATIMFDWEKATLLDVRRVSPNIIEYKDESGKTFKAVRKSNKVVVNGKTYKSCPGGN